MKLTKYSDERMMRENTNRLPAEQVKELVELVRGMLSSFPEVAFAYVYGSCLLAKRGEKGSVLPEDIDVAVYITGGDPIRVELELQLEFYRLTRLQPEVLDVRSLNKVPVSIAIEIITRGELLFCRDETSHSDFVERIGNTYRQLRGLIEVAYG